MPATTSGRRSRRRGAGRSSTAPAMRPPSKLRSRLPFADAEFDLVTCNWVLYHLTDLDAGLAEISRVLRPGGRFVGMYNHRDHLVELWRLVVDSVWDEDFFDCESGPAILRRHFRRVECREAVTQAMWETREAAQTFLDAFAEMA